MNRIFKRSNVVFLGKTLLRLLVLLIALSVATFTLISFSPIDPIEAYATGNLSMSVEQKILLEQKWGLNDPPVIRYFKWVGRLLQGDFGTSIIYNIPVINVIADKVFLSLALMATAWVLSGIIGFLLGIIAALSKGKLADKLIKLWCLILASSPTFWLGILMIMFFCVKLGWFPIGFAVPIGIDSKEVTLWDNIYHMILPAITLSLTGVSNITLHTREKLIQVLSSDFALFAFAKGQTKIKFVRKHGVRNIILPAITVHFATLSELFGGSILAETVFSYPGLGNVAIEAGLRGDMPLLMAITLFSGIFVFLGNFTANLLYKVVDPRIGVANE
ncbi:ABC transporter permease [Candidatus Epulonipiscium fishelsonii]|uniref:ABC transporter permease n=1 Tax=Candidatus Epulonipiscium fishelsonii TaxID=77094 RepID=A0ACC8XD70_9FIRM|nr:ABC transporter permease [Epulopiscium sp. SCG-B11WGA-EpuloA1]ONI41796.1 ABC transporter permease [Epulopiscium sp. SCG-B05WGA-EpuloA1]